MANSKENKPVSYSLRQLMENKGPLGEGLSFSDYFDDSVPYESKPVPTLVPMEEDDFPIQAHDLFPRANEATLKLSPLIRESDKVSYKHYTYNWSEDGVSIFLLYDNSSQGIVWVSSILKDIGPGIGFYSNWKKLAHNLNKRHTDVIEDANTHGELSALVDDSAPNFIGDSAVLEGRLFEIYDEKYSYIMGFWESPEVIRAFRQYIEDYLKKMSIKPETILWAHSNGEETLTYEKMFNEKHKTKTRSKEQLELLKRIHLDAVLKKKVLKLPPHPFELLADKLGVTTAELKQIAGMAIAETKKPELTLEEVVGQVMVGQGFWLDTLGEFHNVDINGNHGHLDWAQKFFKQPMTYETVMNRGYIWVGVDETAVNFVYTIPPTPNQMNVLKQSAADSGYDLIDLRHQQTIDLSSFKGRPIEETDEFEYNGKLYSYDIQGDSVFILFKMRGGKMFWVGTVNTGNKRYMSDWKELEKILNGPHIRKPSHEETHTDLHSTVDEAMYSLIPNYERKEDQLTQMVAGRIFSSDNFDGGYCIGFWNPRRIIKKYYQEINDYLKSYGISDPTKILWTADGGDVVMTYDQFFGKNKIKDRDPKAVELQRQLHLNPLLKKALLAKPVNILQKLADQMGITVPQLRQMAGSLDEVEGAFNADERSVSWWDADAIFTIYRPGVWVVQKQVGNEVKYISSLKDVEKELNSKQIYQHGFESDHYRTTHHTLSKHILGACAAVHNTQITNNDSYHGEVSSRVFKMEGKTVVGFWQNMNQVRDFWFDIEKILKILGVDIKTAKYTFSNQYNPEDEVDYNRIMGKEPDTTGKDATTMALMKIQHLSPAAKKALLHFSPDRLKKTADDLGISVAQLRQLAGSMDEVEYAFKPGGSWVQSYDWHASNIVGIFIIWPDGLKCVALSHDEGGNRGTTQYFCSDLEIEKELNRGFTQVLTVTHGKLSDSITSAYQLLKKPASQSNGWILPNGNVHLSYDGKIAGRVWQFNQKWVCGFWDPIAEVRTEWNNIKWCLNKMGVQPEKTYYTFDAKYATHYTLRDILGDTDVKERDAKELALMRIQHLDAQAKREFLKNYPGSKLDKLADQLGITTIELKQLLGRDVAETTINESPDYMSVAGQNLDIGGPFVVGPFSIGKFYGEVGWTFYDVKDGDVVNDKGRIVDSPGPNDDATHSDLLGAIFGFNEYGDAMTRDENGELHYERAVHGRVYKYNEEYYIGIWETKEKCIPWKKEVLDCLKAMGVDLEHSHYQFSRMDWNEFMSYEDTWDVTKHQPLSDTEENAKKIEQLHLLPAAEKAKLLKQMGAAKPQRLQIAADKLGMSVAQIRQALGRTDESVEPSFNATLLWLEKDGSVYNTDDKQHGLYVADNPGLFGVSNALVRKVFKNANTDENFDFDEASAIMCEKAFQHRWMRVVKIPWRNKIMVEGQEPTRQQLRVLEGWFFEDKDIDIVWQRWVSSKFGPPQPITLFNSKNVLETDG